jgi:hypothetical protein
VALIELDTKPLPLGNENAKLTIELITSPGGGVEAAT